MKHFKGSYYAAKTVKPHKTEILPREQTSTRQWSFAFYGPSPTVTMIMMRMMEIMMMILYCRRWRVC